MQRLKIWLSLAVANNKYLFYNHHDIILTHFYSLLIASLSLSPSLSSLINSQRSNLISLAGPLSKGK